MKHIDTPLLDAHLIAEPRRYNRWMAAKDSLAAAIEDGVIYNAVLQDAKYHLSRGVESALDSLAKAWKAVYFSLSEAERRSYFDAEVTQYCNLNGAPALIKANKNFLHIPEIALYVDALHEVIRINDAIKAVKPLIVKGRRPADTPKVEDLTNTGICSICGRRQKLTAEGKLVHHGFQISSDGRYIGFRSGSCFGVGYLPAEVSIEGNIAYYAALKSNRARVVEAIRRLEAGEVTSLTRTKDALKDRRYTKITETFTVGTPEFPELLRRAITAEQADLQSIHWDLEWNQNKIDKWVAKLLYTPAS
jgi:hypothetical protein